jgi:hypothetical protein
MHPHVVEADVARAALSQGRDAGGVNRLDVDGDLVPALHLPGDVGLLAAPLRRATLRPRDLHGHAFASENGLHGIPRVGHLYRRIVAAEPRVVEAAFVAQLAIGVEDKDVRRGEAAIGFRDGLRVAVVEIREVEAFVGRVLLHVLEAVVVFRVAELVDAQTVGMVGIDRHEGHTLRSIIGEERLESIGGAVRGRAMIGGEEHDQDLAVLKFGEFVRLAVDARELEVGRAGADCEIGDAVFGDGDGTKGETKEGEQKVKNFHDGRKRRKGRRFQLLNPAAAAQARSILQGNPCR